MAGTIVVDNIQSDSSYASTINVQSKINFAGGMQVGGQDAALGSRNRIHNGNMYVNQRGNTSVSLGYSQTTTADYLLDRWRCWTAVNTNTVAATFSQVLDAPTNSEHTYSLKAVPILSGSFNSDFYSFSWQPVEFVNVMDLKWGTAAAAPVTLSFWVKSNLTGQFSAFITTNGANGLTGRSYVSPYTITQANTWEKKTIVIPGDTTVNWSSITSQNGVAFYVGFSLGIGSNSGTTSGNANTWQSSISYGMTTDNNFYSSTSNTFFITGVQLEKGSVATAYEPRQYGEELLLCQRYYYQNWNQTVRASGIGYFLSNPLTSNTDRVLIPILPVTMRGTPSVTSYSSTGIPGVTLEFSSGTSRTVTAIPNVTAYGGGYLQLNAAASNPCQLYLTFSADL